MKSKTFKRCIAIMLCMVIVLSGSGYLLAESLQEGTTAGTETEVQSEEGTTVEEEQNSTDEGTVEVDVPEDEEEQTQENAEAPAQEETPSETEEQVAETPTAETPAEEVAGQATSMTKEIKDANGNVICTVVADVPEGAFDAKPSELEMTVDALTNTEEENVGKLIEDALAENTYVENCVMYRVTFKVNGTDTEPTQSVDVDFKGTGLQVADASEANVFYFAPAKSESGINEDTLVEIPQREAKMQELLNAGIGKTREQLEEENDFSELTVRNGVASELKMEIRRNRIYGCYTTVEQLVDNETEQDNTISEASDAIIPSGTTSQISETERAATTYTIRLWKNAKNSGKKDSKVATLEKLEASTDDAGNQVVEVDFSNQKVTTKSDADYVFYGWSKVNNANISYNDFVYCGDSSTKIKYGSTEKTVFTYDGNNTITFKVSDFNSKRELDLYAVYAVKSNQSSDKCGKNKNVEFFVRYDGKAPYEPSDHSQSEYSGAIKKATDVLYYYQHIYNNSDAVALNLKKQPTEQELKSVLNKDKNFTNKYGNYDSSKYYIEWYVLKKTSDTWHVDGVVRYKQKWTLRYNANTNDVVNDIIAAKQYAYNTDVTVKNTENSNGTQVNTVPVRTGYTFIGWNTKADGTGTAFVADNKIKVQDNYHIYKDSSDTSETAGGSEGAREVTLYAQWRKDYVPQVTTTKKLSHEKYIKKNEDGSYDLTLNVSGAVGTEEYVNKLDVLFVLDTSGSMDEKMMDEGRKSTRFKLQNKAVKAAVENLSQKKGVDARFAIVSFDTMAGINSNWTSSVVSLNYPAETGNYSGKAYSSLFGEYNVQAGGTNYQEGLTQAKTLLQTARRDATKIVVFVSDGDPTFYTVDGYIEGDGTTYDTDAMNAAKTVLGTMTNMQYFYTVGVGPQNSYTHLTELRNGVPSGVTTKNFDGTDAKKLKDAFDSIIKDTTTLLCTDVTITDTLSEYVELVDTNAVPNVAVKDEDGTQIEQLKDDEGKGYAVSHFLEAKILTEDGKTKVQLRTKNGYKLEAGYTYYVTVKIQPTDKAFNYYVAHETYPSTGDKNTDEYTDSDKKPGKDTRNDGSSSEKSGFYSNEAATVTYTYNGKTSTEVYKKPVVQVETISVEKRWVGKIPENESVFVALLKNGKVVQDSSNQNAPRILTLNKDNAWKGNFAVAKVTNDYTVKELRQDESGTISYNGQKYSVVEDKGIVTIAGLTYKTVYSTEDGNPARIITNVENSKKIKIIKTSTNSDDIMLDGAEFTLVDSNGNPVILGENTTNTYTSVNGVVLEAGLNAGTYTLTEIKAPSGYSKLKDPIQIEITATDVKVSGSSDMVTIAKTTDTNKEDIWVIKVKNDTLYDLPETGGIGIFWYTIGGMLLMMAAALVLYKRKCREVLNK